MGRRGLHPGAVALTTPAARRERAIVERLAVRFPDFTRLAAAVVMRLPRFRGRDALIAYAYRRTYAAYNRRDWEFNTLLLDPDSYELRPGDVTRITPDAEPSYRGLEGYLEGMSVLARGWSNPQVRFDGFFEVEHGAKLVSLIRFVGADTGSGIPFDQPVADLQALRRGLIVSQSYYWDRSEGLRAAGIDRARSAAGDRRR